MVSVDFQIRIHREDWFGRVMAIFLETWGSLLLVWKCSGSGVLNFLHVPGTLIYTAIEAGIGLIEGPSD